MYFLGDHILYKQKGGDKIVSVDYFSQVGELLCFQFRQ
jgi:hypothetical protein